MNPDFVSTVYQAAGRQHARRGYSDPAAMEERIRSNIGRGRGPHASLGGDVRMNPQEMIRQEQAALDLHRNITGGMVAEGPHDDLPGDEMAVHEDFTRMHAQAQGQAQQVLNRLENERSMIGDATMQRQESMVNAARAEMAQRTAALPQAETALAPAAEAETALDGLI